MSGEKVMMQIMMTEKQRRRDRRGGRALWLVVSLYLAGLVLCLSLELSQHKIFSNPNFSADQPSSF